MRFMKLLTLSDLRVQATTVMTACELQHPIMVDDSTLQFRLIHQRSKTPPSSPEAPQQEAHTAPIDVRSESATLVQ